MRGGVPLRIAGGVAALVALGLGPLKLGSTQPHLTLSRAPLLDASTGEAGGDVGRPTFPAAPIEPAIAVAPNALGCRSSSLVGQSLASTQYLTLTEPGSTTQVDWSLDGQPLGTASEAPFVPHDAAGSPVPLSPESLAPGGHEVVAVLLAGDGTTHSVFANFVVNGGLVPPPDDITFTVSVDGAPAVPLDDWTLLSGAVSFSASNGAGADGRLELDGHKFAAGAVIDSATLAAGRHILTASAPSATGTTLAAERTFVTTAGQPLPEPCSPIDVRAYGAVGDDLTDDSGAVVAAVDVAMAAGATVHFTAGAFAVPSLKNVLLPMEVAFTGDEGAVLDGQRPGDKYAMFDVDASVSFSGITVRNAGKLFSFDHLAQRVDRFVIENSTFTDVYSPAHVTDPPDQMVDVIRLNGNVVERAVKGFYLPLTLIGHARVAANTLTDVGDAAIRLGSDFDISFPTQRDIDVRDNVVKHVTGPSDANGVKVMGADGVIVNNVIEDVASADGTDSEGIYTKGYGHLIAGNHLLDAGRTQAQINVKSDDTSVADNTIVTVAAETNGLRIEGSNVTVTANHFHGGLPGSIGISTKLLPGFGGYVFESNDFHDSDGIAISTGADGPIVVRDNTFDGLRGPTAVEVRATKTSTSDVQLIGNKVRSMPASGSQAFSLAARSGQTLSTVRIEGNEVTDVASGAVFDVEVDAHIKDVTASGNVWQGIRGELFVGEEKVDGFTPG
jgi:hypothetical protein